MKPRVILLAALCAAAVLALAGCDLFLPTMSNAEAAQATSKVVASTSGSSFSDAAKSVLPQTINGAEGGTCTVSVTANPDTSMSLAMTYSDFGFTDSDTGKVYYINGTETMTTGIPSGGTTVAAPLVTYTYNMSATITGDLTIRSEGTKNTDVSFDLTLDLDETITFNTSSLAIVFPSTVVQTLTGTINGVAVNDSYTLDLSTL